MEGIAKAEIIRNDLKLVEIRLRSLEVTPVAVPSARVTYASQAVVVMAPGKDYRLCVDHQGLNELTKPNIFPLPNMRS